MPLQTFLNLSPERQQEVTEICLQEFALHGYKNASLGRIIKQLQLGKGSFYRYFKNKQALFEYLVKYAREHTFAGFDRLFKRPVTDIFQAWIEHYLEVARKDRLHPLCTALLFSVINDRTHPLYGNMAVSSKRSAMLYFKQLLERPQVSAGLRPGLDLDSTAYLFSEIHLGVFDYLAVKYDVDFRACIEKKRPLFAVPEEALRKDLQSFMKLLQQGVLK